MPILASERHFDDEEEGNRELELVAVTYVGDRSLYNSTATRTQGQWPSYGPFQRGETQVAFVPDGGLGYFESHADFEVEYSPEGIADALLGENYLAPDVFSAGTGGRMRQRVLDELGIEQLPTTADAIRAKLADIAGREDEGGEEAQQDLADRLADPDDGFSRSQLKDAAADLREGSDDISLNAGKLDFAEWLAGLVDDGEMTETELLDAVRAAGGDD